jgi:hypothetical protein
MIRKSPRYIAYILRLWPAGDPDAPGWRAMLEHTDSRQRTGFGSIELLFTYLREQTGQGGDGSIDRGGGGDEMSESADSDSGNDATSFERQGENR